MMNQKCRDGRKKTMMLFYVKTDTKTREEICNTRCCQISITNNHRSRKEETSYIHRFYLQATTLSSLQQIHEQIYDHQLWLYRWLTAKEANLCTSTLICLCSCSDLYLMLIKFSKLTSEPKTRKIGYRDAIYCYVPETTYHKPSLCLMLIIREPHFHLYIHFKHFLHMHYRFIATYIHNRCQNFHLQLKTL